jgi:hypothetical protein
MTKAPITSGSGKLNLCEVLLDWQRRREIDAKEAARRIGLSHTVYWRLVHGKNLGGDTLATVLRWLLTEGKE